MTGVYPAHEASKCPFEHMFGDGKTCKNSAVYKNVAASPVKASPVEALRAHILATKAHQNRLGKLPVTEQITASIALDLNGYIAYLGRRDIPLIPLEPLTDFVLGRAPSNPPPIVEDTPSNSIRNSIDDVRRAFQRENLDLYKRVYAPDQRYWCVMHNHFAVGIANLRNHYRSHVKEIEDLPTREQQATKRVEREVNAWLALNGARDIELNEHGYIIKERHWVGGSSDTGPVAHSAVRPEGHIHAVHGNIVGHASHGDPATHGFQGQIHGPTIVQPLAGSGQHTYHPGGGSSDTGPVAHSAVRPEGHIHKGHGDIGGHTPHGGGATHGSQGHMHGLPLVRPLADSGQHPNHDTNTSSYAGPRPRLARPDNTKRAMINNARFAFRDHHLALYNKVYVDDRAQKYACALDGCSDLRYTLPQLQKHFTTGVKHPHQPTQGKAEEWAMAIVELEINGWFRVNGAKKGYGAENGYEVSLKYGGSIQIELDLQGADVTGKIPFNPSDPALNPVHSVPENRGERGPGPHGVPGPHGHPYQDSLPDRSGDHGHDGRARWNDASHAGSHAGPVYAGQHAGPAYIGQHAGSAYVVQHAGPAYAQDAGGSSHGPPHTVPPVWPAHAGPPGGSSHASHEPRPAGEGSHHGHIGQERPSGVGGESGNQTGPGTVPKPGARPWELK